MKTKIADVDAFIETRASLTEDESGQRYILVELFNEDADPDEPASAELQIPVGYRVSITLTGEHFADGGLGSRLTLTAL